MRADGGLGFLAIETTYTESFSTDEYSKPRYCRRAEYVPDKEQFAATRLARWFRA